MEDLVEVYELQADMPVGVISGWYGVLVFGNIVRIGVNFLRVPVFVVVFAVYSVRVA